MPNSVARGMSERTSGGRQLALGEIVPVLVYSRRKLRDGQARQTIGAVSPTLPTSGPARGVRKSDARQKPGRLEQSSEALGP